MQPAARGLRGAVRHEETPDDEAVATLAAMFPHVPAPVLRRTLAISVTFAATPHDTRWGNHVEGGAVDAGAEAAPGTAYLATGGAAAPGAGEQKLNLGRPLATLAPGSEPPALPADPRTVFTAACPVSPPKSPFALSRTRR